MLQCILSMAETVVQSYKDKIKQRARKCTLLYFLHIWTDILVVISDTADVSFAEPSCDVSA